MATQTASGDPTTTMHRTNGRPSAPRASKGFDRAYWVGHCEGYRVDSADGRLGFVDEVRSGDGVVLAVRAGLFGRRLLLVPADEVAFIVPRAERLWLRSPVVVLGTERG